ncbi:hypothetical protein [Streptacidiphilus melanogenes]|uniref:hypothetical protein n=1 Tax=Streptacidiphilus melanogenes TaxID=411235 RepID=UPI000694EBCA|nr:hypothetical protein [Streptacidiphilus melanogenes]
MARAVRVTAARIAELWRRGVSWSCWSGRWRSALFLVTLMPLLVIIAPASVTRRAGLAQWITDAMSLTGQGSAAVRERFATSGLTLSTTTAGSVAAVAVFGIALMGAVQGAFERMWDLPRGPWHSAARQAVALAGLLGYLLAAARSGSRAGAAAATGGTPEGERPGSRPRGWSRGRR